MYERHQLLDTRLRQQPDRLVQLLAQDVLVDPRQPPAINRALASALAWVARLVAGDAATSPTPADATPSFLPGQGAA